MQLPQPALQPAAASPQPANTAEAAHTQVTPAPHSPKYLEKHYLTLPCVCVQLVLSSRCETDAAGGRSHHQVPQRVKSTHRVAGGLQRAHQSGVQLHVSEHTVRSE